MSKKLSEEEFQGFVVEQFGKLTTDLAEIHTDLAGVRVDVTSLQTGLVDVRSEIAAVQVEMQTGFRELRSEVAEIKEILAPLVKAFDIDAEKIVEHERRIIRVEKHLGLGRA